MREILFRGKIADEPDEWVQGYLLPNNVIWQMNPHKNSKCCGVGQFTVRPETIGQYTGLKDKNGKMIFEGDIVEFYFFDKTRRNGELITVKNTRTILIEWYNVSFCMRELFRNYRLDNEMGIITETIYDYNDCECEEEEGE